MALTLSGSLNILGSFDTDDSGGSSTSFGPFKKVKGQKSGSAHLTLSGSLSLSSGSIIITGSQHTSGSINVSGSINIHPSGSINLPLTSSSNPLTGSIYMTSSNMPFVSESISGSANVSNLRIYTGTDWTTLRVTYPITYTSMSINHVSGTSDAYVGVGSNAYTSSAWAANPVYISGSYRLGLIPSSSYWRTERFRGYAVRVRVHTNITLDDLPAYDYQNNSPTVVDCFMGTGYMVQSNGSTTGPRSGATFSSLSGQIIPLDGTAETGTTTLTANIGDPGTMWLESPAFTPQGSLGAGIGRGDSATYNRSPYYYTFLMYIGAGLRTKTYKFEFEIDYVIP